jgi:hypothetical protein
MGTLTWAFVWGSALGGTMTRYSSATGLWVYLALLGSALACGCTFGPKPSEDTPVDPATEAAQACEDTADAVASSAERCGYDYQTNYDLFVEGAGAVDCSDFTSVRDIDALYDDCIPFLSSLSCAQIDDPALQLPASCKSQLLK